MPGSQGGGGQQALASPGALRTLVCCRSAAGMLAELLKLTLRPLGTVRQSLKSTRVTRGATQSKSRGVRGVAPASHTPQHRLPERSCCLQNTVSCFTESSKGHAALDSQRAPAPPPRASRGPSAGAALTSASPEWPSPPDSGSCGSTSPRHTHGHAQPRGTHRNRSLGTECQESDVLGRDKPPPLTPVGRSPLRTGSAHGLA